jgi:hypothetical protein
MVSAAQYKLKVKREMNKAQLGSADEPRKVDFFA